MFFRLVTVEDIVIVLIKKVRYDWWVYFNFVLAKQKITKQTDINKIMFLVL